MSKQPAKDSRYERAQSGFTLLELIVVMVIMSVVMAVLLPRLSGQLMGNSLQAAVSDLSSIATSARFRAADTGKEHVLVISRKTGDLKLLSGNRSKVLSSTQLPEKVAVGNMELLGKTVSGPEMQIVFYPRGTASPARLKLVSEKRESMHVFVAGANGGVYVR
ncbi:prepilin-type N-terminal cleavage/methylation domain-containing protein [Desulfovibrio sp. JC010]|uniref:prepilin-type N-terminal cleavage/methylation domain-containing protein n=1 Tax=Desulfovibrio sp. JC010 TaxID=2593641 RepID=UPI0013D15DEE|nr:prepilin-type N-terminal cleavage/methylation domain-containing protein [Desulfovibrio sp. JC010]NDV27653.1 prepilin-type N-terminal cleavage/methylation domain-containing protein [Desulfovibrio sp. JC010]